MEHAAKAVGAAAAWMGPAVAVWLTNQPWVALAFIGSTVATMTWFMGYDNPAKAAKRAGNETRNEQGPG